MKKFYYPSWYRLDNKDRYLIWYSIQEGNEDLDGVVLDSNGKIPIFVSLDDLFRYAQAENIPLEQEEPHLHNLDAVIKWFEVKRSKPEGPTAINCDEFLAAWNLFSDVSRSINGDFDADRDRTRKITTKLFWGNNWPSVTPEGECYIPLWSRNEKTIIREVLLQGLQMFRNSIRLQ